LKRAASVNCEALGTATVTLGGGREKKEDSVDPAVGLVLHKKVGDKIAAGDPLCTIHYNAESRASRAHALIEHSYHIGDAPAAKTRVLVKRVIKK